MEEIVVFAAAAFYRREGQAGRFPRGEEQAGSLERAAELISRSRENQGALEELIAWCDAHGHDACAEKARSLLPEGAPA